jgi:hypothetical protein
VVGRLELLAFNVEFRGTSGALVVAPAPALERTSFCWIRGFEGALRGHVG